MANHYPSLNAEKALIWRIAHRDNLPWILDNGLHCANSVVQSPTYINIGNADLIDKRRHRIVPIQPGGTLADYVPLFSFPRAAWECGQGALRRKSRCLYGTQRVQYCIPTQRVGTRGNDAASRRHLCIKTRSGAWELAQLAQVTVNVDLSDQEPA